MLAQNSYRYIQIGLCLRFLRNVSAGMAISSIRTVVENLERELKGLDFPVALSALKSLSFGNLKRTLELLEDSAKISPEIMVQIAHQYSTLEEVVFAEAGTKQLYVLPKRRFNTDYLLVEPQKLLRDGAFNKLDEIARSDIASAGRCLLFGEATAAAFHILRATESVLKDYYFLHRKTKRLERPMWGPMVDQLRAKKRNSPPASLLQSLDLIRTAYRNPTQHPEALYQIDAAQDLLGVCLDAIGKMAAEL